MPKYSLEDSGLNVMADSWSASSEDLDLVIEVTYVRDLGYRGVLTSRGDQVADSGGKTITQALGRLFARSATAIAEYRSAQEEHTYED
jgi:hypothetical protein